MRLTDDERLDWLRLIRTDRIGPRTFRGLIGRFGSAGEALRALPDLARQSGRGALRSPSRTEAEREVEALARLDGQFVALGEPGYPKTLLATDAAPPLISVRGSVEALGRPTVAIVGSRNASAAGGTFAGRLATELGQAGYVIVSGLARGIDTRAHRAALQTGTVAVLAGGHDQIYPAENKSLLNAIIETGGAAVTEMPMGWTPRGQDFPRRNRIVSGLSYGTVVVEAARRSGSLITARLALEQGREVFAAPGSPLDLRAEGTNELIRSGATLCAAAEHVRAVLDPLIERGLPEDGSLFRQSAVEKTDGLRDLALDEALWDELDVEVGRADDESPPADPARPVGDAERVLALLSPSPISVDALSRQAELPVRDLQRVLLELELDGRIERHGGHAVSLAVKR